MPSNQDSTLNLTQHDDIPLVVLNSLPFFTREDQTTPIEHIRGTFSLCGVHHITQENVAIKLLDASFKHKSLQWFIGLPVNSVAT